MNTKDACEYKKIFFFFFFFGCCGGRGGGGGRTHIATKRDGRVQIEGKPIAYCTLTILITDSEQFN